MALALAMAAQGEGLVEPNPPVGCVIVRDGRIVGQGFHERFGGPHAEVVALQSAGEAAKGATAYVTLEPCCHYGKTPPCTEALVRAGIARVVVAAEDPYPEVAGKGIAALKSAGIACEVGTLGEKSRWLLAPYWKRVTTGRPWIIAKWAMTLDGKLATRAGDSQWISSEASRAVVHRLRGRVDAILIGSGTARADNPLLTARPEDRADWKRAALRIVFDSAATLAPNSRLVQTARDIPVLVAASREAPQEACQRLVEQGVEVYHAPGMTHESRLESLLDELGRRQMTNVLVEGGGRLLGALFDQGAIDELHAFIAPKLVGGATAPSPITGSGVERMAAAVPLADISIEELSGDIYVHGRLR
jgi:diaminohydroxyphosphoribosylaminopyrimidine deaminase/5-amino-6-(5-phosphoribosylamino)uracil reductase